MKQVDVDAMEELNEGLHEDCIGHLGTAYRQVQYVFDEMGTGFGKLTRGRINLLRSRLLSAMCELDRISMDL